MSFEGLRWFDVDGAVASTMGGEILEEGEGSLSAPRPGIQTLLPLGNGVAGAVANVMSHDESAMVGPQRLQDEMREKEG